MTGREVPTVVFDLDGTLVSGSSYGGFLRELLYNRPGQLAAAVLTTGVWVPLLVCPPTRVLAERYLAWLATLGLDEAAFADLTREFAQHHAGPKGGRVATAGLATVRQHLEQGARVLVATECPEGLAHEVCQVLGIEAVEVVASPLRRGRWGMRSGARPCRGTEKLRALEAVGVRFPVDHAYSDSVSDLPLLKAATIPHVVSPRRRNRSRFVRELGKGVDIQQWARHAAHP